MCIYHFLLTMKINFLSYSLININNFCLFIDSYMFFLIYFIKHRKYLFIFQFKKLMILENIFIMLAHSSLALKINLKS